MCTFFLQEKIGIRDKHVIGVQTCALPFSVIRRMNNLEGPSLYRLPTEAEWEYACRAGNSEDVVVELNAKAWYINNSGEQTNPNGQKLPNAWGLYDMHGNV